MVRTGESKKNRLRVRRVVDVPLREVSGICLRRSRNGRMFLIAVGDRVAKLDAWRLGDLDGKPEGLALTAQGRAIVGLDTRKPRRNLVLLDPAVAHLRGRGQSLS